MIVRPSITVLTAFHTFYHLPPFCLGVFWLFLQSVSKKATLPTVRKKHIALVCLAFSILLPSCMPTRGIPEDQYLLNRNRIMVENAHVDAHQLRNFHIQTPNRRIFGLYRFNLNVYQLADRGEETRLKRWMKNTIGEPPVLFDRSLADQTSRQFELYMHNKGYFNADVGYDVRKRGKRADVIFTLRGNQPYTIRNIDYTIPDKHLARFVYADTLESLISPGDRYDVDVLQQERQRLTRVLKDQGFFNFSRDFIFFSVDSTLNTRQIDLEMIINNPRSRSAAHPDGVMPHKRYVLNNIYVYPCYSRLTAGQLFADTTVYRQENDREAVYSFLHNGPMQIRPKTIAGNILFQPGDFYSISRVEQTHYHLAGLRNFRFVNLQFNQAGYSSYATNDTIGALDVKVELTRAPANAFTIEAEGLNTAGNLGIAGNFLYQNRNFFRGAEIFNLRLKGALEVSGESVDQQIFQRLPFNTMELGADVSVDFPKLLIPFRIDRLTETARTQTTLLTGFNYRQRPDYTRYILNMSYSFQWQPDQRQQHQFIPLEISSIKIFNDSILQSRIPDENPLILSRYRDHLIGGMKYNYTFSTQQIDRKTDFFYFRSNIESAGNLMYLAAGAMDLSKNQEGSYTIRDIPFAQYVKGDADLRYYRVFDDNTTLAFRIMGGLGIPFGNIDVMPFIKSYYAGGANSVRAWSIYNLGPGGYPESHALRFDKYGDIKLEANVEYRFPVYRYFHGAFFIDAGNVWFLERNEQFPRGEFAIDRFYKEIAIGSGLGLRLDFNFFLVRLDAAFPVRNPGMPVNSRWIDGWPRLNDWNFNLGIGYPF